MRLKKSFAGGFFGRVSLHRSPRWRNNPPSLESQGWLVGGWTNPFEKHARQNGNLPQIGVKIKNIWNHLVDGSTHVEHWGVWWVPCKELPTRSLTAIAPEKLPKPNRKGSSPNHHFVKLRGGNISPTRRHFWVDDFPNLPRWDMLVSWRVSLSQMLHVWNEYSYIPTFGLNLW